MPRTGHVPERRAHIVSDPAKGGARGAKRRQANLLPVSVQVVPRRAGLAYSRGLVEVPALNAQGALDAPPGEPATWSRLLPPHRTPFQSGADRGVQGAQAARISSVISSPGNSNPAPARSTS